MGALDLTCMTMNGTRLVVMSIAQLSSEFNSNKNNSAVILLEPTVSSPSTLDDLKVLSVISFWPREVSDYLLSLFTGIRFMCSVDPISGVFSAVHSNTSTRMFMTPNYLLRAGFQYDPRTRTWTDLSFSSDYGWKGNQTDTFILFSWPKTSILCHAYISGPNTLNVGDPTVHGYFRRLVYGNSAIYHIGSIITNKDSGAQDVMITRISLSGQPGHFVLPNNLTVIHSVALDQCASGIPVATLTFYADTLYIFCTDLSSKKFNKTDYLFKYQESGILTGANDNGAMIPYDDSITTTGVFPFQAMARGGNESDRWCVSFLDISSIAFNLNDGHLGNITYGPSPQPVSLPYGQPDGFDKPTPPPNYAAIIGGSVTGGLMALFVAILGLKRWVWPRWRGQIKARLLETLMQDEVQNLGEIRNKGLLQSDGKVEHGLREVSMSASTCAITVEGKIPVSADMEFELNKPIPFYKRSKMRSYGFDQV
ncbi:hypothetical protein BGZ83_007991 [Gryganskiella cystojenkinii]|nr:hypothetical protein BGZ83_007991 [Gryganskiella cystojenkinii]